MVKGEDPASAARPEKSHTLESYLKNDYGPWVKAHRKTGAATIDRIKASFPKLQSQSLAEFSPQQIDKAVTCRTQFDGNTHQYVTVRTEKVFSEDLIRGAFK